MRVVVRLLVLLVVVRDQQERNVTYWIFENNSLLFPRLSKRHLNPNPAIARPGADLSPLWHDARNGG